MKDTQPLSCYHNLPFQPCNYFMNAHKRLSFQAIIGYNLFGIAVSSMKLCWLV
jgi:hypothetical protein